MEVKYMGLLDKASDAGSKKSKIPVAKAVAKAKPVAKAVAKAKPVAKAVAKAKPVAKAVAKAQAVPVAKQPRAKRVKSAPRGLPEDYEMASANARRIAWFTNFVINMGPIIGFFASVILDAFTTVFALIALVALLLNLIIVPLMSGRSLGNFVSRTKSVTSSGVKPIFLYPIIANSAGILALSGVAMLMVFAGKMLSATGNDRVTASIFSVLGIIFLTLYFINYGMRKGNNYGQGLYDTMFGAFLVKHVPAEGEVSTGFIGRLEGMATYGDRFTKRQEEKTAKKAAKVETDAENESKDAEEESTDSEKESVSEKKVVAKAKKATKKSK